MRQLIVVALALSILAGTRSVAAAKCGDKAEDAAAVAAIEAAITAQCSCCGPEPYATCVKAVMKTAARSKQVRAMCTAKVRRDVGKACPLVSSTTPCRVCSADADCGSGELCDCRRGSRCAKTGGICTTRPLVCPEVALPVCGCDGTTYANDCFRQEASACKLHDGPCIATGGCFDTIAGQCTGQACSPAAGCPLPNALCSPTCGAPPPTGTCFDTLTRKCTTETCGPDHACLPNQFCVTTCPPPPPTGKCFVTVENQCSTEPCGPGQPCRNPNEFCNPQCLAPTCASDADCNDGNACTADTCVNGTCAHGCVCADPSGATSCCPGPAALCARPCGRDATSGACGGVCPAATEVCTPTAAGCACAPALPACGETFPTCGGSCPAGTLCATATSTCRCVPEGPQSCGNSFPACGGTCPTGMMCTSSTGASACQCVPADCQAGSGALFFTCGDPVCRGHRAHPGIPPCATTEFAGTPCSCLGRQCDPGDACNRLLECATSDPTHGGMCPL